MNIYHIQHFWFQDFLETNGDEQKAYLTIDFPGRPNVSITAQVNVVAPGAYIKSSRTAITGDIGSAAVGIKSYIYYDENGNLRYVDDLWHFVPHAIIRNCSTAQIVLAYRRIWVSATGTILYFTD